MPNLIWKLGIETDIVGRVLQQGQVAYFNSKPRCHKFDGSKLDVIMAVIEDIHNLFVQLMGFRFPWLIYML